MKQLEVNDSNGAVDALRPLGLHDFVLLCWRSRLLLVLAIIGFAIAGAVAAWMIPPKYEATVLLSPVSRQGGAGGLGALGSTLSQLSGVASTLGLAVEGGNGGRAGIVATLQSEILTERYIQAHDLLPVLFSKLWDAGRKRWRTNDPKKIPTLWKANLYFSESIRSVVDSTRTGLVTLTIRWRDPQQAAAWANGLVALTNDYLRTNAINESERNIAYLNEAAAKTSIVEIRSAIYTLMESEFKNEMMARGNDQYALKVIDPATVPERKSFPKPLLWTLAGAACGLMLGILYIAIRRVLSIET